MIVEHVDSWHRAHLRKAVGLAIAIAITLTACSVPKTAPFGRDVELAQSPAIPLTRGSVADISIVSNDVHLFDSDEDRRAIETGLRKVFERSKLFFPIPQVGAPEFSLQVTIEHFQLPRVLGTDTHAQLGVAYQLVGTVGEVVLHESVTSRGVTHEGRGLERASRAKTASVVANIEQFASRLPEALRQHTADSDLRYFARLQSAGEAGAALPAAVAGSLNDDPGGGGALVTDPAALGESLGNFHALVIGNNQYRALPPLETAVNDAVAVGELLQTSYSFNVSTLLDATRADVLGELARLRRELTPTDNLLIYYAGHGWFDELSERGYWLPVDAVEGDPSNWVSNADIVDGLKALEANHVMVVADSCFSGTLTRGIVMERRDQGYLMRLAGKRTRVALTSGGLEPVVDGGGSGHSVFAQAFLNALLDNDHLLEGTELFSRIRRPVLLNAEQTPEYGDIRLAGHEGGDFLFLRTDR